MELTTQYIYNRIGKQFNGNREWEKYIILEIVNDKGNWFITLHRI